MPDARTFARDARDRALTKVIRARVVVAPMLGSVALTFAFFEPTAWRRAVLGATVALLFGLAVVEWLRYRRSGLAAVLVPVNVVITAIGQLGLLTATGGVFSPVVPGVIIVVLISALLADRRTLVMLVAIIGPWLWLLAIVHATGRPIDTLLPALFGGAQPIERGPAPFVACGLYTAMLAAAARVGIALRHLFEDLFADGMRERDRALALHAEQSRALTTLSAEIAHELKNPLASVKGLAALVAKDAEGRASARIAVLRTEVDRMQTILDEFLNFSRPLVPLSLADVRLGELARDVANLHEGSAIERRVRIDVEADDGCHLRCDPRKVRQILINLLQNALDASPAGATVTVRVERSPARDPEALSVSVIDEGAGLAAPVAGRVFEAGVTSKEHGSGLGLAVARSLARQHGGELTLRDHEGGGAIAELTLPADCAPEAEAAP